jgi:lysozyme family protein
VTWEAAWKHTVAVEGDKYTNDPSDSGGPTKWGVTEKTARANGYTGSMEDLDEPTAKAIGKKAFWDVLRLDDVARLSDAIAMEMFDTGYNCGPGVAAKFLQRGLNALNHDQDDFANITEDSAMGHATTGALALYMAKRHPLDEGELVMLRVLNGQQLSYYLDLTRARVKDEKYFYGWVKNRVEI